MARNYAALPHEYLDEMDILTDAEFGRLCRALLTYSKTGEMVELDGAERVLLRRVCLQEQRFQENYDSVVRSRREAGQKGASKRWQLMANDSKAMTSDSKNGQTKTETKTKTKTNPSNEGITRATRFTPPTLAEVQSYVAERHSPVDPQGFLDFYESKGWMVGKTPMKDWKAACRNAEKWDRWDRKPKNGPTYSQPSEQEEQRIRDNLERTRRLVERMKQEGGE